MATAHKSRVLDMTQGDPFRLVLQFSMPLFCSNLLQQLYNLTDTALAGHLLGSAALAEIGATAALYGLIMNFAFGMNNGLALTVSRYFGAGDESGIRRAVGWMVTLSAAVSLVLTGCSLLGRAALLTVLQVPAQAWGGASAYLTVILLGNVVTHMYLGLNSVLRASGHPRKSMYATINTVVINTILDPLFIFGFGWGIRGAAIATVLAQVISLVWQLRILSNKQELLHFRRGIYRLRKKIVRDMLAIGMSPFLMNLAACFIVILINKGLKEYGGDLMIGAYGIVNRLAFFFVMIVLGVNQGMQPIAGYNFGAKQYDRVMHVLKLTMIGATCVTTAGFLLGEFMPRLAVGMFTSDEELIRLAVEGMRIVFFCFPIIGFQMVATNFFMSIGMAGKAIFLSLSRQLLFLMPGLIFLPHIFDVCTEWNGSWGVWCSMPLSDFLASLVAFFMLTYQLRKFRAIGAENAAKEG